MPGELVGIIIVCRHGIRNPKLELRHGCISRLFEGQPMHLTERGRRQMLEMGRILSVVYAGLLSRPTVRLTAHCSGHQRSIRTAISILNGLSPSLPIVVGRRGTGANVLVEPGVPGIDTLFHEGKGSTALREYQISNLRESQLLGLETHNPDTVGILDHLHKVTGLGSLDPSRDTRDRLLSLKTVHSLITTATAEGVPLCREEGWDLTRSQLTTISSVAGEIVSRKFGPGEVGLSWARSCSSRLRGEIATLCTSSGDSEVTPFVTIFSGHETTLVSLGVSLGVVMDSVPGFGACLLVEMWRPTTPTGDPTGGECELRLAYHHDPRSLGTVGVWRSLALVDLRD